MLYRELGHLIQPLVLGSRLFVPLIDNFVSRIQFFQLGPDRCIKHDVDEAAQWHDKRRAHGKNVGQLAHQDRHDRTAHDGHDDERRTELGHLAQPPNPQREDGWIHDRHEEAAEEKRRDRKPAEMENDHPHQDGIDQAEHGQRRMGAANAQDAAADNAPRQKAEDAARKSLRRAQVGDMVIACGVEKGPAGMSGLRR